VRHYVLRRERFLAVLQVLRFEVLPILSSRFAALTFTQSRTALRAANVLRRTLVLKIESETAANPMIRLRIEGRLGQEQLAYLDELVQLAETSGLRTLLDLHNLVTLDSAAIRYLLAGEGRRFELACPGFIRQWLQQEVATMSASRAV
jgi:hypothetical protein